MAQKPGVFLKLHKNVLLIVNQIHYIHQKCIINTFWTSKSKVSFKNIFLRNKFALIKNMKNVRIGETLKKRKIGVYFQVCFCFKSLRISVWRNFIIQLGMFTRLFGRVRKSFDKFCLIETIISHQKLLFLHLWPNRMSSKL